VYSFSHGIKIWIAKITSLIKLTNEDINIFQINLYQLEDYL